MTFRSSGTSEDGITATPIAEHADPHLALAVSGGVPALAAGTVVVVLARKGSLRLKVDLKDRRHPVHIASRAAAA